jgi:hypothetical protein
MALDRATLRHQPGVRFWKLLGTGDGRTFDARDADLRRWAVLTVWSRPGDAGWFARPGGPLAGWRRLATEHWWTTLRTARTHGTWSGDRPFAPAATRVGPGQPVAALTRARLRWARAGRFWRAVPPVNADLPADALLLRLGIGEAPVGLQGTFSVWRDLAAMRRFAYAGGPHREVIARSRDEGWYAEELFARFAVLDHGGTVFGADPLEPLDA